MKKILLIIALLISGLGLNAQSVTIDDLEFRVTSETPAECEVSGYSGEPTDVTIPSKVTISGKEYSVTSIGDYAFFDCSSLTSIEIPSGVTSIGYPAFSGCSSLTSIEFEENSQLTSIGDNAFSSCSSLTSIEIPSGVTSIGSQAFYGCSGLTSVTFGENSQLTSIGFQAFDDCYSLESIEIPSGVTSIGIYAFRGCFSLTSIEIPSGVTSIGNSAFEGCSSLTSIVVESGNTIYDSRDNCNAIIETATNTLIAVCQNTVIPNTITYIGERAFSGCSSLTSIIVESGNTVYDSRDNCNAIIETATNTLIAGCQNTVIPNSVTSIGEDAFYDCSSLTSIEIPSGVTSIGDYAFSSCDNLTSIDFGENSQLASIGESAFSWCESLTSIEIPNSVTSIGERAFYECSSLTSIDFGENSQLSSIGDCAFWFCSSLTSIDFGENSQLTSIGERAFGDCSSLTSIEIPSGVASIGDWAFSDCSSLTSIYCYAESVPETYNAFYSTPSDMVIYVPEQSIYAYKIASPWKKYTIMVMPYFVIVASNPEDAGIITGAGAYAINDTVTLTATANEGYKFINWTENDSVISEVAEYTFVVENDREFVANFELLTYEVTASVNDENFGAVTGADTYSHGEEVTLTATANEGYKFVNWTENDTVVSTEAEYSFVITGDRNLVANFELLTYEVVASVNIENAGEITGAGSYEENDTVTLTAKANEGYKFVNWTENDTVVSTEAEYTFVITGDRSLVANFVTLYEVTASVNDENFGSVAGVGIYGYGEEVTLTATANEGYKFVNWTENDTVVSTEAEYSFVITGDRSLVANFVSTESISELEASFKVYPNPVSDMLFIEAEIEVEEVAIFDVYGRQQNLSNSATQQLSNSIDVSSLNNGVYFVKVVTSEGEVVKRFIKE